MHWLPRFCRVTKNNVLHAPYNGPSGWKLFALGRKFSIRFGIRSNSRGYFLSLENSKKKHLRIALEDKEDLDDWADALMSTGKAKVLNRD